MDQVKLLLRHPVVGWVTLLVGVIMGYAAFFLREDEQAALHNRVEGWWIQVDDMSRAALSRHVALFRVTGTSVISLFDRFLGSRLLSFRAFGVLATVSALSTFWVEAVRYGTIEKMLHRNSFGLLVLLLMTIVMLYLPWLKRPWWLLSLFCVPFLLFAAIGGWPRADYAGARGVLAQTCLTPIAGLFIGVLLNVLVFAIVKSASRQISAANSLIAAVLLATLVVCYINSLI